MSSRLARAFGYADLGRAGLGNKLFPYVRCLLWCRANGATMLPSRFIQIPIGPLLRGEKDLRLYTGIFRRPSLSALALRTAVLGLLPKEAESGDQRFERVVAAGRVFTFAGLGEFFRTLVGSELIVTEHLRGLVNARWLRAVEHMRPPTIGVHVRLGDFSGNMRHPVEWYVDALRFVRGVAGWTVPATIFSDGHRDELAPLLHMDATGLATSPNAFTDLIHLSRSRFLIGTGSSTFGAWAAFMGQMPALTRLGNPFSWWHLQNQRGRFIGEVDVQFERPPRELLRDIRDVLGTNTAL